VHMQQSTAKLCDRPPAETLAANQPQVFSEGVKKVGRSLADTPYSEEAQLLL